VGDSTIRPKILLSWSAGKDSAWSLHVLRRASEFEVVGLLTTINEEFRRGAISGVREKLLDAQAEAAGLPVRKVYLPHPCSNQEYEEAMLPPMGKARDDGIEHVAFGDLFLEDIREYRDANLAKVGMTGVYPIWGADTATLAAEMQSGGLRARIATLDPKVMPESLAGKLWDAGTVAALPDGVDPCGESGEFHTFAFEGPMFSRSIPVQAGEIVKREGFVYADIVPDHG
jgi:uncharacterized protein (TIGR00290 family)